jgi:hypothetical protein
MTIFYLFIGNKKKLHTIFSFFDTEQGGTFDLINEIKSKGDELMNLTNEVDEELIDKENEKYNIYYKLNKDFIFYFVAILKNNEQINSNIIFNMINEIDNEKFNKFIDKNENFNNLGNQEIKNLINKYNNILNNKIDYINNINSNTNKLESINDIIETDNNKKNKKSKNLNEKIYFKSKEVESLESADPYLQRFEEIQQSIKKAKKIIYISSLLMYMYSIIYIFTSK